MTTTTDTGSLSTRSLLASISISCWTARRYDRRISEEVAETKNVDASAGNYRKRLLPAEAPEYDDVRKAAVRIRSKFYEMTLPWLDDGTRILPARLFTDFQMKMSELIESFNHASKRFVQAYPRLRDAARMEMGTHPHSGVPLFREEDYPADIAGKFGAAVRYLPMPESGDFRAKLSKAQIAMVKNNAERGLAEAQAGAMRDVWDRLHKATHAIATKLGEEDKIFRNSLIANLREVLKVLPALNLTDDPTIDSMAKEAEDKLAQYEADQLRTDKTLRRNVADDAADIARRMSDLMGGNQ